jgi:hypothetical protein
MNNRIKKKKTRYHSHKDRKIYFIDQKKISLQVVKVILHLLFFSQKEEKILWITIMKKKKGLSTGNSQTPESSIFYQKHIVLK